MYELQVYMSYWADEVQLVDLGRSYFTTMDMLHSILKILRLEQFCLFTFSNSNSVRFPVFTSYTGAFLLFKDAGVVLDVFLAILRDLNCKIVLEQDAPESF